MCKQLYGARNIRVFHYCCCPLILQFIFYLSSFQSFYNSDNSVDVLYKSTTKQYWTIFIFILLRQHIGLHLMFAVQTQPALHQYNQSSWNTVEHRLVINKSLWHRHAPYGCWNYIILVVVHHSIWCLLIIAIILYLGFSIISSYQTAHYDNKHRRFESFSIFNHKSLPKTQLAIEEL